MLQASSDPETNRFFRSPLILLHVLFHLGLKIVSLTKKYTVSPTVSKLSVSRPVVPDSLRPPWTAAHQAPLSMRFTKQGYWSGLPFPSPGDLPNPAIEPGSPALQADSLLTKGEHISEHLEEPWPTPARFQSSPRCQAHLDNSISCWSLSSSSVDSQN